MTGIELLSETCLSLTELSRRERVNPGTVWRWVLRGVKGVKLESARRAGRRVTSEEAFDRFLARINGAEVEAPSFRSPRKRQRAIQQADDALTSAGI